jgi:hypothetical protein
MMCRAESVVIDRGQSFAAIDNGVVMVALISINPAAVAAA